MSINDIYCCDCDKEFSWAYREYLIKHKHKRFRTFIKGKAYIIEIEKEKQK